MFALAPQRFPSDRSGDIDRYDSSATEHVSHNPHTSCSCDLKYSFKKEVFLEMISTNTVSREHIQPSEAICKFLLQAPVEGLH